MERDIDELRRISDKMGSIQLGTPEADDDIGDAITGICEILVRLIRKVESQGKAA